MTYPTPNAITLMFVAHFVLLDGWLPIEEGDWEMLTASGECALKQETPLTGLLLTMPSICRVDSAHIFLGAHEIHNAQGGGVTCGSNHAVKPAS